MQTGIYKIHYHVNYYSPDTTSATRGDWISYAEDDTGGSWAETNGSRCGGYVRETTGLEGSMASASFLLDITVANQKMRLMTNKGGTDTSVAIRDGQSTVLIERKKDT